MTTPKSVGDPDPDRVIRTARMQRIERALRVTGRDFIIAVLGGLLVVALWRGLVAVGVAPSVARGTGLTAAAFAVALFGLVTLFRAGDPTPIMGAFAAVGLGALHLALFYSWGGITATISTIAIASVLLLATGLLVFKTVADGLPSGSDLIAPISLTIVGVAAASVVVGTTFGVWWAMGSSAAALVLGATLAGIQNASAGGSNRVLFGNPTKRSSALALAALGLGLTYWILQPSALPPAAQLRDAAKISASLLLIAFSTGVAAMVTVQFWKVMFFPRAAFHETALWELLGESLPQVFGLARTYRDVPGPRFLQGFYSARLLRDVLDNPTEIVIGQLRSAADYILLRPSGYEDALLRLAGPLGKDVAKTYLALTSEGQPVVEKDTALKSEGEPVVEQDTRLDDLLTQLRFLIEQRLNTVHLSLRDRWRRRVRLASVFAAGLMGLVTITLSDLGPIPKMTTAIVAAVWGGVFSWLARDLVAIAERRRV